MLAERSVLHIVRRFSPLVGGTERLVEDLALAQADNGHIASVFTADRDVAGTDPQRLPHLEYRSGLRIVRAPVLGNARSTVTLSPVRLIREIRRAEAVHLHDLRFMTATVALAARIFDKQLFVHTHGLLFHTSFARRVKVAVVRWYYAPWLSIGRATILASSESDRRLLLAICPGLARRTVVLPNGLDLSSHRKIKSSWTQGQIVAFGRLVPSKGLDDLIRAFARISDPTTRLVIAGPSSNGETADLGRIASALGVDGRVSFLGLLDRQAIQDLISQADVVAFPSRTEGFGLALLEAMAAGCVVVARDIPAHRALLAPGLERCLVDFSDPEIAATALTEAMRLSPTARTERSKAARNQALAYDVSVMAAAIDHLYRRGG